MKKAASLGTVKVQNVITLLAAGLVVAAVGFWLCWWGHPMTGSCTSLSLSQGMSSGAAGTIYKGAVITNTGSKTCTVTGYPGVFMLNGGGTQVGSGAAANALYGVSTVTLAPGAKARSVVAFPQQPNFPPGTCSPIGSSMKLYVPGLATPLMAPWSDYSCPGFSATAFQPGAS